MDGYEYLDAQQDARLKNESPAGSSDEAASSTAALERALATLADEAARVNDTRGGSDEPLRYPALSHATELARVALARFQERP